MSGFDLDQLGPTLFRRMCCFCGLRFGRFFASVLARGIQISEKKNAGKTINSTWFANSHAYVVALVSLFNLQAELLVLFFEGAHFDFRAESI